MEYFSQVKNPLLLSGKSFPAGFFMDSMVIDFQASMTCGKKLI
jgi:hypothetical protein